LTKAAILAITTSSNLKKLHTLNLTECDHVDDEAITGLANTTNITNLQTLILDACDQVSDTSVQALIDSNNITLRKLSLNGTSVSEPMLQEVFATLEERQKQGGKL
jgi:hypothetical protein